MENPCFHVNSAPCWPAVCALQTSCAPRTSWASWSDVYTPGRKDDTSVYTTEERREKRFSHGENQWEPAMSVMSSALTLCCFVRRWRMTSPLKWVWQVSHQRWVSGWRPLQDKDRTAPKKSLYHQRRCVLVCLPVLQRVCVYTDGVCDLVHLPQVFWCRHVILENLHDSFKGQVTGVFVYLRTRTETVWGKKSKEVQLVVFCFLRFYR